MCGTPLRLILPHIFVMALFLNIWWHFSPTGSKFSWEATNMITSLLKSGTCHCVISFLLGKDAKGIYFSRNRGIFKECYEGNETHFLDNVDDVIDGNVCYSSFLCHGFNHTLINNDKWIIKWIWRIPIKWVLLESLYWVDSFLFENYPFNIYFPG